MSRVLVSGLINIETTLRVEGFPIPYVPVRYPFFGIQSTVSGVGYNVARALTVLGDDVRFLSLVGDDAAGLLVRERLTVEAIPGDRVLRALRQTPQSVILYDGAGRRLINTDLKDIQEQTYPVELFDAGLQGCALAALCNVNFSRPFLARAHQFGVRVATDVHTISDLDDDYNRDFMAAADILFMSGELLPCSPEAWVRRLWDRYGVEIAVVGLGAHGALLGIRGAGALERLPAVRTRPVVSTIGAGDALFSAFIHEMGGGRAPEAALRRAMVFASYKIGEASASAGFLDEHGLAALIAALPAAGEMLCDAPC